MDITNFWDASVGTWDEIQEIPDGFTRFAGGENGQTSTYYTNAENSHIVRVSDHWGSGIRECNWYLRGYRRNNCRFWKDWHKNPVKIGIVAIADLVDVREK